MKKTKHNIAVIGATGFVGRQLCRALAGGGAAVYAYDLPSQIEWSNERIHYRSLNVLTDDLKLPESCTSLIYLAQSPHYRAFPAQAADLFGVNAWGPARVAEAFASSGSVYAPSLLPRGEAAPVRRDEPYALSKLAGEEILQRFDAACDDRRFLSLRLFGLFGPGQRNMLPVTLTQRIVRGEPITLQPTAHDPHDRDGLRVSWLFVGDLVALLGRMLRGEAALEQAPAVLNLAGPQAVSIREFATHVAQILNKQPVWQDDPKPRTFDLNADITLMRRLLHPDFTPLKDAITRTVEAFPK
jgi:nucleoside-diphosphate-sugar epimerase